MKFGSLESSLANPSSLTHARFAILSPDFSSLQFTAGSVWAAAEHVGRLAEQLARSCEVKVFKQFIILDISYDSSIEEIHAVVERHEPRIEVFVTQPDTGLLSILRLDQALWTALTLGRLSRHMEAGISAPTLTISDLLRQPVELLGAAAGNTTAGCRPPASAIPKAHLAGVLD